MQINPAIPGATALEQFNRLSRVWQDLCQRFLPVTSPVTAEDSLWRYSRAPLPDDPEQGWKLHISATILNAHSILETVAPLLIGRGVQFKAPACLDQLGHINTGLHHEYSQVGKFITVYPRTNLEAVSLAAELHELTSFFSAPSIPFDRRFKPDSNVYYRYGAFRQMKLENPDGSSIHALRRPDGKLVPDLRDSESAKPDWVDDPFPKHSLSTQADAESNPLKTTYKVFRALSQRGKGGVYQAIDLSAQPPRFCLLKEGRRHGELGWDGRDGYWRVEQEERVLRQLRKLGVTTPEVYGSFDLDGNRYLVTEFITGESLQSLLSRQQRRLSISRALDYGNRIALLLDDIHSVGWVWRDCKPANLMLTDEGQWRPLDFEGACPINQPDDFLWRTPAYTAPANRAASETRSSPYDDLYALGVILYQMLTGKLPNAENAAETPEPVGKLRRGIPIEAQEIVMELLTTKATRRPSGKTVARLLKVPGSGGEPVRQIAGRSEDC